MGAAAKVIFDHQAAGGAEFWRHVPRPVETVSDYHRQQWRKAEFVWPLHPLWPKQVLTTASITFKEMSLSFLEGNYWITLGSSDRMKLVARMQVASFSLSYVSPISLMALKYRSMHCQGGTRSQEWPSPREKATCSQYSQRHKPSCWVSRWQIQSSP